jgi:hypothetical protein
MQPRELPETQGALTLVKRVSEQAITGLGPLKSAEELAEEYMNDNAYSDKAARIQALIRWESSKSFSTGFITGLGGFSTLPAAIPASLGASWVVQARLAAAIARIHGHDLSEDRIRTLVMLSLIGNAAKDELKWVGIRLGNQLATRAIRQISGRMLVEINRRVGFRMLAKAGEKGVLNLSRLVPVAGGLVGGTFDAVACRAVGHMADTLFATPGD